MKKIVEFDLEYSIKKGGKKNKLPFRIRKFKNCSFYEAPLLRAEC